MAAPQWEAWAAPQWAAPQWRVVGQLRSGQLRSGGSLAAPQWEAWAAPQWAAPQSLAAPQWRVVGGSAVRSLGSSAAPVFPDVRSWGSPIWRGCAIRLLRCWQLRRRSCNTRPEGHGSMFAALIEDRSCPFLFGERLNLVCIEGLDGHSERREARSRGRHECCSSWAGASPLGAAGHICWEQHAQARLAGWFLTSCQDGEGGPKCYICRYPSSGGVAHRPPISGRQHVLGFLTRGLRGPCHCGLARRRRRHAGY